MKKSVSTLLVVLVLMNIMGYYALLLGLQYRNTQIVSHKIQSGNYVEGETQLMKLFKPGYKGTTDFSKIDGEFEQDGQVFRLIKQRLYKDTFHIVFIKDERGTLIKHALSDYARTFSDKSDESENQLIILPVLIREYLVSVPPTDETLVGTLASIGKAPEKVFIHAYCSSIIHPPQIS